MHPIYMEKTTEHNPQQQREVLYQALKTRTKKRLRNSDIGYSLLEYYITYCRVPSPRYHIAKLLVKTNFLGSFQFKKNEPLPFRKRSMYVETKIGPPIIVRFFILNACYPNSVLDWRWEFERALEDYCIKPEMYLSLLNKVVSDDLLPPEGFDTQSFVERLDYVVLQALKQGTIQINHSETLLVQKQYLLIQDYYQAIQTYARIQSILHSDDPDNIYKTQEWAAFKFIEGLGPSTRRCLISSNIPHNFEDELSFLKNQEKIYLEELRARIP
ncbi:hypothetical protein NECID01_2160 [Nematocida sp. AWRm77]|nr:hypothetical protein NECID01_2160 [Nematocida sp. AWRm77]